MFTILPMSRKSSLCKISLCSTTEKLSRNLRYCLDFCKSSNINFCSEIYRCSSGDWTKNMAASFIQAISVGNHAHCPAPANPASSAASVSQVYSYEKFLGGVKLGQVVNIVDNSQMSGAEDGDDGDDAGAGSGGNGVKVASSLTSL